MKIVVLGASGLIGSALVARLSADQHEVVAVSRNARPARAASVTTAACEIGPGTPSARWRALLRGADALVNCAGTLQDAPGESTSGVHVEGLDTVFAACETIGVRRVVHISALGVERQSTPFSRSKLAGDQRLMRRDLDWIILRPSVVVGHAAYGGSALLRGLASLPVLPVMPDTTPLRLVHLDDVVDTIVHALRPDARTRIVLELVGPRACSFADAIALFRAWLGWRPARRIEIPRWAAALIYRVGDAVSWLGWRPPVRSTTWIELSFGTSGDAATWSEQTGIVPRDIEQALAREPASVQERWFARLYVLKPLVFAVFGLFWLSTGIVSFGPGWDRGLGLLHKNNVAEPIASLAVAAGASADIAIGIAILYRQTSRYGLWAALTISLVYLIVGTFLVPRLWGEPLGPLLKILPIIMINLVTLAIREDR